MPIYCYRCENEKCGKTHEIIQKVSDSPVTTCPSCGQETLKRTINSDVAIQFKGSGFYITDYPKNDATPSSKPKPPKHCGKSECGCSD